MLLSDLFDQLRHGELSQHKIGGKSAGEIKIERYPEMVTYFNSALLNLHGRFLIREDELVLQQHDSVTLYKLEPKYATNSGSNELIKYIIDTPNNLFLDNILRIERVYDELAKELPINDSTKSDSIYTPKYNVIQIPLPVATNALTIIYRGNHPRIKPKDLNPLLEEIDIPDVLIEALLNYISYKIMMPLGGNEFGNISQEFLIKYETACKHVLDYKLLSSDNTSNIKLELFGWV